LATSSRVTTTSTAAAADLADCGGGGVALAISFIESDGAWCEIGAVMSIRLTLRLSKPIAEPSRLRLLMSGDARSAVAATFAASIQPPGCLPGMVGCSKVRAEMEPCV
jgi:hypothetical protein